MFEVRITAPAEDDIQQNFTWWRDNRDADQAAEWYDSIYPAINSLSQMPRRCTFAREQDMYSGELRQLYFGVAGFAKIRRTERQRPEVWRHQLQLPVPLFPICKVENPSQRCPSPRGFYVFNRFFAGIRRAA